MLDATAYRYVYNGDRVLEKMNDSGTMLARYTLASGSYFAPMLHMKRSTGESRHPLMDGVGTVRTLVADSGTVTDTWRLNAFGEYLEGTGSSSRKYQYGGAWGYLNDPSGLQQLGARFYWPELGRFISQDPSGDGVNWYAYVGNNPVTWVDPEGLWAADWHGENTEWAALEAGFSPEAAAKIGKASHDIDNWTTLGGLPHFDFRPIPYGPVFQSKGQFSSMNMALASSLWAEGDEEGALTALGQAMHAIQDDYAHGDAQLFQHKSWMDDPCDPRRSEAADNAYYSTVGWLRNWLGE